MSALLRFCTAILFVLVALVSANAQSFPFVIPGDDSSETITSRSELLHRPAGKHGFIRVEDDHFFAGEDRIRFWGMNLCFSANFPSHEVADFVAPHLAKLGINAIRFHHMDTQSSPSGIWGEVNSEGDRLLDPEMVDRLDYFLAKLHDNGIYANLNMHTGRTLLPEEGFPKLEGAPWWAGSNKWVMYYDKSVQAEVKQYCREMLTHKNPYRDNKRRCDDPGLAMVEMLNENYFTVKGYSLAHRLPKRFQESLIEAWNLWLVQQYGTTDAMMKVWTKDQPAMGSDVFPLAGWKSEFEGWTLSMSEQELPREFNVEGPADAGESRAVRISPKQVTEQDFRQQLGRNGQTVLKDQPLTLSYWVRSDSPRSYVVEMSSSAGGEWRDLGIFETLDATSQWQKVQRIIIPGETIKNDVGLHFNLGNSAVPIEFAAISLRQGAQAASLPSDQRIETGTVAVPTALSPIRGHADMKQFMIETEATWVRELKTYLKDELGVKVPITASQINYHTAEVNETLNDFVDLHNYWHHPIFPSDASWDPKRWNVGRDPMEADPERSSWPANSLLMRMPWRLAGKPMTLSEWNCSEPSPASAGCVPMAAALGALQDWDAVFFFDYDSTAKDIETWRRQNAINFFDFNGQPVKLAAVSMFANVFLRGDLKPLQNKLIAPIDEPLSGALSLSHWVGVSSNVDKTPSHTLPNVNDMRTPDGSLSWKSKPPAFGVLTIDTHATQGLWGTIANETCKTANLEIAVQGIEPNYGLVVASTNDGLPMNESKSILLLAASRSENVNMNWNDDRTSVGDQWGDGPTQVTGFDAKVRLKGIASPAKVFVLDGTGKRIGEAKAVQGENAIEFDVSATQKSIWYEIAVGP